DGIRVFHVTGVQTCALPIYDARKLTIAAAAEALTHVQEGMRLGIGTGSTAEEFVRLLAEKVQSGFKIIGVPTSDRTEKLCNELRSEERRVGKDWGALWYSDD